MFFSRTWKKRKLQIENSGRVVKKSRGIQHKGKWKKSVNLVRALYRVFLSKCTWVSFRFDRLRKSNFLLSRLSFSHKLPSFSSYRFFSFPIIGLSLTKKFFFLHWKISKNITEYNVKQEFISINWKNSFMEKFLRNCLIETNKHFISIQ